MASISGSVPLERHTRRKVRAAVGCGKPDRFFMACAGHSFFTLIGFISTIAPASSMHAMEGGIVVDITVCVDI